MLETLAQYKILDRIGAGGMGEVYRARDTRLGRTVAIKVLPEDVAGDPERRERFLREARATAMLSHPNIAALYEIGEDQNQLFLAFEFVPGDTLQTVIGGRPLNPRRAIGFAIQLADAMADAHAAGIVHRDIKPANVIVTPKGHAKILDFGLATWTEGGAEREQAADSATVLATAPGIAIGTVAYMSPEQALGKPIDHRTDIFSLGIVLFEMLTGVLPFTGPTPTALALEIVQHDPPAPSEVNRDISTKLDGIVAKALSKKPAVRYQSATELADDLRVVAAEHDGLRRIEDERARGPLAVEPRSRWKRFAGLGVAVALLVAVAAGGWSQREELRRLWRRTTGPAPSPVIAVIPLELASGDASLTYFADGLTEDLITRLGQTPGLKVIGRSAMRRYRGRSPLDVARELGAGVVLTGTVRPATDTMKVSLELTDPTDGTNLWAQQYTLEVKDVFAVQARVAREVASALKLTLRPTAATARAEARLVDHRAYDLYLRGRHATAQRQLQEAVKLYEDAIAADAGLAEAFAGLAEALHLQIAEGHAVDPVKLKTVAERSYQLDEDSAAANLAMGLVQDSLADTLKYMRRALDVDGSFAEAYHQIGDQIQDFAPDLSVLFYQRSVALDPRLDVAYSDLVVSYVLLNRPDEARRVRKNSGLGQSLTIDIDERRYDAALAAIRAIPTLRSSTSWWSGYIGLLESAGQRDEAFKEALQFGERFSDCEARALVAGLRRDRGQAAAARELTDPIFRDAASPAATPATLRCAAGAAAAMNDPVRFASVLDRIAAREDALRHWALQINGGTGGMLLRGRVYPFTRVVNDPQVAAARRRLDAAYAREREAAQKALAGLLDRS